MIYTQIKAARRGIDALINFISVANVANITKVMLQSTGAVSN